MTSSFRIDAILIGQIRTFTDDGEVSAIAKEPVAGPQAVTRLGILGDNQADRAVHGGPDKAIHQYPRDHYPWWRETLGANPLLDAPGAFGENVSTAGLTEDMLCIGDRFRMGTALIEVAQGRQPCWKQSHRLGSQKVLGLMVGTGRTGWYWRVIEDGLVEAGDELRFVDRQAPDWSVARVFGLLIGGKGKAEPQALRDLAKLACLAENWRARAARLAGL